MQSSSLSLASSSPLLPGQGIRTEEKSATNESVHSVAGKSGGSLSTVAKVAAVALFVLLGIAIGGAAGFLVGGPVGAAVGAFSGALLGAGLGIAITSLYHRHVLKKEEAARQEEISKALGEAISSVKLIQKDFTSLPIETQRKDHEQAKDFLNTNLPKLGATVEFISPPERSSPSYQDVDTGKPLSEDVFTWENTSGVEGDIQRDGHRTEDNIVIYGVASQYNGCEAPAKFTVPPGDAVQTYRYDPTQGPKAQLQFHPDQVELINCAGNLGFNTLCNTLDEDTRNCIAHGYFTPDEARSEDVLRLLSTGKGMQFICVGNKPYESETGHLGDKPVHQILVAAPAFGGYSEPGTVKDEKQNQIQFLCALHAFRAQFQQCIALAEREGKAVVFKPTGVGLGVFGNDPQIVGKAFYQAATEYEDQLRSNNVQVRFQVHKGQGKARDAVDSIGLKPFA